MQAGEAEPPRLNRWPGFRASSRCPDKLFHAVLSILAQLELGDGVRYVQRVIDDL